MKKIFLVFVATLLSAAVFAQDKAAFPRTITVTGSAEREITPDEIYVQVYLKEYDKKGSGKVSIDKIRQEFLTAVRSLGLPDSAVTVSRYDANNYNPWWKKKAKKDELFASITYQVQLRNTSQIDQLVDRLDDAATQNFYISQTTHSRLEEFKKTLKMQAVKAAKEKAQYLAGAINETIGVAITINEPGEYFQPYYNNMASARMLKTSAVQEDAADQPQADFKKMKLRYDVTVVFALQ